VTSSGLSLAAVTKRYPGTTALRDVSFDVRAGSFHALLGGNGSGKSTLIKVLAGVVRAEPGGSVTVDGERCPADAITPGWARAAGVRFVHQDLGLFEPLSVAENLALGAGFPSRAGCVRWAQVRRHAREQLAAVGLGGIDPRTPVAALRPAQRTLVAIARALDRDAGPIKLLVLDEPTASLPAHEVEQLLSAVKRLTAAGTTVLYATHRLAEVLAYADDLTVVRDGRHVATRPVAGLDEDAMVELIVGRSLAAVYPEIGAAAGEVVVEVRGLRGGPLRGVDLAVRRGEVLGIAGTVGSGRSSLLRMLFGAQPRVSGTVTLRGQAFAPRSPAVAMRAGVAYVPEDRARDAAFLALDVSTNLAAATVRRNARLGRLQLGRERAAARDDVARFGIRASSCAAPMQSLSGGNQQKVVLARWLRRATDLLLLDEPTQGVDVGARADIYEVIRAAARGGRAVAVVSSDFEELAGIADRVLVLAGGRIVAEGRPPHADCDWIAHQAHAGARAVAA
jgi:ribose transport system ATP-binding protein